MGDSINISQSETSFNDRDRFLRYLLRDLSGVLEDVIGLEDAEGFISIVANGVGQTMLEDYRELFQTRTLTKQQLADVLVDLKRRIDGGFSIESMDKEKIVLHNTKCPFDRAVVGRPSMCMMTSNVFGRITAETTGYARVELQKTIARADDYCRVVVHLTPPSEEASTPYTREYRVEASS